MGHLLLQMAPDTVPWRRIVALIAEGGDVAAVTAATTEAAVEGLRQARDDRGLLYTVWLLIKVVLAARQDNFGEELRRAGLDVAEDPGVYDLVGAFSDAIDHNLHRVGGRSDIGEMAQLAGVESLTALIGARTPNLFDVTAEDVKGAARQLSTEKGFGTLSHDFFAHFIQRFLTYHLDRELPLHVGGNGRFADPAEHSHFLAEMGAHCRRSAVIVERYAGAWYSKHNFLQDITPRKVGSFANYALKKLRDELTRRGAARG
jgi:hypothetical protein